MVYYKEVKAPQNSQKKYKHVKENLDFLYIIRYQTLLSTYFRQLILLQKLLHFHFNNINLIRINKNSNYFISKASINCAWIYFAKIFKDS